MPVPILGSLRLRRQGLRKGVALSSRKHFMGGSFRLSLSSPASVIRSAPEVALRFSPSVALRARPLSSLECAGILPPGASMAMPSGGRSAEHGALLELHGLRASGASFAATWKAWSHPSRPGLRWEIRRILPSLEYDVSKAYGRTCDRVRGMKFRWEGVLGYLKMPAASHYGSSAHSMSQRQARPEDFDDVEQEYWFSTQMLILFLLDLGVAAGNVRRRDLANRLLESFVGRIVDGAFCQGLEVTTLPANFASQCDERADVDGRCGCWRSAREELAGPTVMPQHLVATCLKALHSKIECVASASFLKWLIDQLADRVALRVQDWGNLEYHRAASAALVNPVTHRRRRFDFHAKGFAVHLAMKQKLARNPSAAGSSMDKVHRSQTFRWVKEEMAAFQAEAHLSSKRCDAFAVAYDCARIGQPGRETMLVLLRNLRSGKTVVLPPQVMRDWTPLLSDSKCNKRVSSIGPGLKASLVEGLRRTLRDRVDDGRQAKQKRRAGDLLSIEKQRRKANRAFLERLDNACRHGAGVSLSDFRVQAELRPLRQGEKRYLEDDGANPGMPKKRSFIIDEAGRSRPEMVRHYEGGELSMPTLHITSDLGSLGLSGAIWLVNGLKLRATFRWDVLHRIHCAVLAATASADLMLIRLESLQALKVRQGPFLPGGANHSLLVEAAQELWAALDESNPLFEALYQPIAEDLSLNGPDIGELDHVRRVWLTGKSIMVDRNKGVNPKNSRWFSFETKSVHFFPELHLTLLVLVYVGFRRGWWRSVEACPLFFEGATFGEDDGRDLVVPGEASAPSAACVATEGDEEEGHEDPEGPSSSKFNMSTGRAEVSKRRKQCISTLNYTVQLLSRGLNVRLWKVIALAPQKLQTFFNEQVTSLKTRCGARCANIELVDSRLAQVGLDVLLTFNDPQLFASLGLSPPQAGRPPSPKQVEADGIVASSLWKFLLHLCGRLGELSFQYQMPPLCFVALTDTRRQADWLRKMEELWTILERLEAESLGRPDREEWVRALLWPRQQWSRQILLSLAEDTFSNICEHTMDALNCFADSFETTLPVENLFNAARAAASENRKGELGPTSLWHRCVFASSVMADHDMPMPSITGSARAASAKDVAKSSHVYEDGLCSIEEEDFMRFVSDKPDWPAVGADGLTTSALRWQAALAAKGSFDVIDAAWLSLLLLPGQACMHKASKTIQLVLHSCPLSALTCRAPAAKHGDIHIIQLGGATMKQGITFQMVTKLSEWKVAPLEPLSPAQAAGADAIRGHGLLLKLGQVDALLQAALRRGLRNMSIYYIRKLFDHLDIKWERGKKPKSELALIEAIFAHVFPDCSKADVDAALLARHKVEAAPGQKGTNVMDPDFASLLDADGDEENLEARREIQEFVAETERKLAAQKEKGAVLASMLDSHKRSGTSSSASSGARRERKFMPIKTSGYSRHEAQAFCPPNCKIAKDLRENRWKVEASFMSSSKSKSYGRGTGLSDYEALKTVLLHAWREHRMAYGGDEALPIEFEESDFMAACAP